MLLFFLPGFAAANRQGLTIHAARCVTSQIERSCTYFFCGKQAMLRGKYLQLFFASSALNPVFCWIISMERWVISVSK